MTEVVLLIDRGGKPIAPPFEAFPEAPVVAPDTPTYTVVQMDTLRSIAFKLYQDASMWLCLAAVNGIADPQAPLVPNTQILVPPVIDLIDWT